MSSRGWCRKRNRLPRRSYFPKDLKLRPKPENASTLGSPTDRYEKATFMPERANPANLRQPTLGSPVVGGHFEKLLRILADERAGVRSDVLDAVLGKPALNLGERVSMLLGMLILVA